MKRCISCLKIKDAISPFKMNSFHSTNISNDIDLKEEEEEEEESNLLGIEKAFAKSKMEDDPSQCLTFYQSMFHYLIGFEKRVYFITASSGVISVFISFQLLQFIMFIPFTISLVIRYLFIRQNKFVNSDIKMRTRDSVLISICILCMNWISNEHEFSMEFKQCFGFSLNSLIHILLVLHWIQLNYKQLYTQT